MKLRHRLWSYGLVIGIVVLLSLIPFLFTDVQNLASPPFIRDLLRDVGGFGYFLMILLLLLSILLPVPSTPIILGGGYVYGTLIGSLISLAGIIIGATISFHLIRTFGRPLLEKIVDSHHIAHFNHVFKKRGAMAVLISYAVPVFPSDAISLLLGLTRITYSSFIALVIIGHIPRILLINSLGHNLQAGFTLNTIFILAGSLVFVLIAAFRERIKKFIFAELKTLEKEAHLLNSKSTIRGR